MGYDKYGKYVGGYDPFEDAVGIKSIQKKYRECFNGTSLDANAWDSVIGAGGAITVAGGNLTLASGTTINSETYVLTKEYFTVPFRVSFGLTLSQRIVNQTFLVEAVSIDPVTLLPDGKYVAGFVFDGATVTQAKYRVGNGVGNILDSSASTFPTTAGGALFEIEPFADECWFHGGTMDSTSARANSYRRHQGIPDPKALYKVRLRWLNGGTAPASSTNAVIPFVAVQDYAELTAEITAGRGQTVAGQAIAVQIAGGTINGSTLQGYTAHDSAITGNPVRIGGRAVTVNYTAVATGDVADFITTLNGVQIVKPYAVPELDFQFASTAVVNTTDVVIKTALASNRNYLTAVQLKNTHATVGTEVVIKDGATVIWRGYLPANMAYADVITFPTPLKTTANTALNFACITTGANVYVSAQGYQAP